MSDIQRDAVDMGVSLAPVTVKKPRNALERQLRLEAELARNRYENISCNTILKLEKKIAKIVLSDVFLPIRKGLKLVRSFGSC